MRIYGRVDDKLQPVVTLTLLGFKDKPVDFILDTGFTFKDDREFAIDLLIKEGDLEGVWYEPSATADITWGDNSKSSVEASLVSIDWDGSPRKFRAVKTTGPNMLSVAAIEHHAVKLVIRSGEAVVIDLAGVQSVG